MNATSSSLPAPRFAFGWATLACVIAALTLAYPALSGGFLVNPVSDQYIAGYAFREYAATTLRDTGAFPLWNPYLFGGMPYVAAMHGDIFYPTFLLRMVLPTDVAMTWGMILHLMLAGVAGYAFLRAIGIGFHAALVGGIAYMMSGQVASLVSPGHDGKLFVSALLPVTLLVLTWGIRDAKQWAWGVLALVVGLGVLSPHPQLLQYLLLASGAWALMLSFGGAGESKLATRTALTRLGLAFGAVLLGMTIGAIQYLPVREYVDWSPRANGRDYTYATSFSMPIEELFNTYLPPFTGILDNYWGRNGIHFHSEYLGAGVLFLAALAFGAVAIPARRRMLWFWTGVLVISLLWALGGNTPFYHIVYAIVPGSKFFRAPSTIFFITTFAVAVLAAMGTERVLAGQVTRRWCLAALGVGGAIALLASVGALQAMALTIALPQQADRVSLNDANLMAGAWRSCIFLAGTVLVVWMLGVKRLTPALAGWALAALTAADLWSVERQYFRFSAPAAELYSSDAIIEHIKRESQPVRVITTALAEGAAYHDPALFDGLMTHRIRIATGYHGNELGRYQLLGDKERNYAQIGNPAFWGLANVKYLYTNVDSLPGPDIKRVAGPVRNAAGTMVSLFELPGEHPFAWVAPVIAKYPDASVAEATRVPTFPYRAVALIDTASSTPAVAISGMPAPLTIKVTASAYSPGRFSLDLDSPAPAGSALVVSENYYPGWTATVDGQPAKAERANLSLMAVALPAGARKVEFTFDSAPYHSGKRITLAALALSLLAAGAGLALGRTRGRAQANG
jgi:Bacterial membrane protein YfhO